MADTDVICPNEACLGLIDCADPALDCGQYDAQETIVHCPYCATKLIVTTHITYSADVAPGPPPS